MKVYHRHLRTTHLRIQESIVTERDDTNQSLRTIRIAGALLVVLYALFFVLMQSHTLWESPTLLPDRWPFIYRPLQQLLPHVLTASYRQG